MEDRTELSDVGEFGLIKKIEEAVKVSLESTIKGIGDDAAVLDPQGKMVLLSTDMLNEGVHFDLSYTPLKHLGYKAAIVNFSDILAMNAYPSQLTVSLGLSNRFSLEAVDSIYEGLLKACELYNVDLVGGDTTSSVSGLTISLSVTGFQDKDKIVYRDGAKEGDLVCVSGDLGAAYMGLQILEREKAVFKENPKVQPDLSNNDYILERQLKPEARKDIIRELEKRAVLPTSMLDISDGLVSELFHISNQSKVGATIYSDKLPIDPQTANRADEFQMAPETAALNGGEDYELLFTIKQADYEKVRDWKGVSVIGKRMERNFLLLKRMKAKTFL
jgi:thiamine-monophosphate kinase